MTGISKREQDLADFIAEDAASLCNLMRLSSGCAFWQGAMVMNALFIGGFLINEIFASSDVAGFSRITLFWGSGLFVGSILFIFNLHRWQRVASVRFRDSAWCSLYTASQLGEIVGKESHVSTPSGSE